MYCLKCKTKSLNETEIEEGLKGYHCSSCDGHWIRANDYHDYVEHKQENSVEVMEDIEYKMEYESKKATFCPDCGSFLIKYKVSNDIPFNIDHCGNCHGVWLDKNEWPTLVGNGLHKSMNKVFTNVWQKELREAMTKDNFIKHYEEKFGSVGYDKIKEIRQWLYSSELKDELLTYLMADEPYKL